MQSKGFKRDKSEMSVVLKGDQIYFPFKFSIEQFVTFPYLTFQSLRLGLKDTIKEINQAAKLNKSRIRDYWEQGWKATIWQVLGMRTKRLVDQM